MRRFVLLIALVLLFACLSGQKALADGACAEFTTVGNGCAGFSALVWFPFGGYVNGFGWVSRMKIANTHAVGQGTSCPIQAQFTLVTLNPGAGGTQSAYYTDNQKNTDVNNPQLGFRDIYSLNNPDSSVEIQAWYPAAGNNILALGSVQIGYFSATPNPDCLRGLVQAQVNSVWKRPDGIVGINVSAKFDSSSKWVAPVSATAVLNSAANQGLDPSMAIVSSTSISETVRITVVDQNGQVVVATGGSVPDVVLAPFGGIGIVLRNFFGQQALFPNGKDLTGQTFVEVVSPSSGGFVSFTPYLWENGAMGSLEPTPLK